MTTAEFSLGLSLVAVVLSAFAVFFSWKQAKHAARQADAATGEVDPSFHAYLASDQPFSSNTDVIVEVINFNRRPLLIHSLTFEQPDHATLYHRSETLKELQAPRGKNGTRTLNLTDPIRIAGCGLYSEPERFTEKFTCAWGDNTRRSSAKCGFRLSYTLDGHRDWREGYASVVVSPPKHDW